MDGTQQALFDRWREQLRDGCVFLPDKPEETPDSTLRALWFLAIGERRSAVAALAGALPPLEAAQIALLEFLLTQRLSGTPLAHLTRRVHFMGLEMLSDPSALVPRRETELLARTAIECAHATGQASPEILDACTGSGNVALALADALAGAHVHGADLDEAAVDLARNNAAHLGLDRRVEFKCGDLLEPYDLPTLHGRIDLLTCNPPYISSGKVAQMAHEISAHEPRRAFDGGPLGVSILMRLIEEAPRLLRGGGWLVFEVGAGQGPSIVRRMQKHPHYVDVEAINDETGIPRVVRARRSSVESSDRGSE